MSVKGSKKVNNFIIDGNTVKMELKRYGGKESLWTIIDLEDLERVKNFPYSWHATYDKTINDYYVVSSYYMDDENGNRIKKPKQVLLHVFIMQQDSNIFIQVDHRNHDPKDNRKENLRVIEASKNARNRDGKNSNNKTGYRNVAYVKSDKEHPYYVQLMINGKNTLLNKFSNVDDAGAYAKEMRKKYYGKYKGND